LENHVPSVQPHTAKAAYFSCIDDRLAVAGARFLASLEGGAFHPAMAGGGAAFLTKDTRTSALKQVAAAYTINHVTDIYLESHTDCGAYRLAGVTFDSPEQELERLLSDLVQAAALVHGALAGAGAAEGEITIHLRVVNPTGRVLKEQVS
jgi:carbonic anhydrase